MKRITKEIVKKDYKSINPLIARDYMAKKISRELDIFFEYKKVIIFPSNEKINNEKLNSLLTEVSFITGKFFKSDYKNFNKNSLSVAIIQNISFELFKKLVKKISKEFRYEILARYDFNVYLFENGGKK